MKKLIILSIVLNAFTSAPSQTKISNEAKLKAQIIALETSGWEAWKKKNGNWFQINTTDECVWINSEGISDKAQMIKSTQTECTVASVALNDFKFVMLNENTVLLTYVAVQNGSCGNKKLPEKIRASVNYVKRGKKWLEAFYMETTLAE